MVSSCAANVRGLPSEVSLEPGEDPIPCTGVVSLDGVESVSAGVLVERIGALSGAQLEEVCVALAVAIDC